MTTPRFGEEAAEPAVVMPVDIWRHRFMFTDGETLDVLSPLTDSRVGDYAYTTHYGVPASKGKPNERIVGSTVLGPVGIWGDDEGRRPSKVDGASKGRATTRARHPQASTPRRRADSG